MKAETEKKIREAYDYCAEKDKSTEFTIQYIQDVCKVDLDCVMNWLSKQKSA